MRKVLFKKLRLPAFLLSRSRKIAIGLTYLYAIGLVALAVQQNWWPRRSGGLALLQVFTPYFFLPLFGLLPVALWRKKWGLSLLLASCLLVWGWQYPPPLNLSPPEATPDAVQVEVASWNTQYKVEPARNFLRSNPADIVALQEINSEWLAYDEEIAKLYPYQLRRWQGGPPSLALLSRYPIEARSLIPRPNLPPMGIFTWATIRLEQNRRLTVVNVHTFRPDTFRGGCRQPWCYNAQFRDSFITYVRQEVARPFLQKDEPLLLVGDFNVTDREPPYHELTGELQDAFRATGFGPANTWGPFSLLGRYLPILKIDHMFSSPQVRPLRASVECIPRSSDHCPIRGRFEFR